MTDWRSSRSWSRMSAVIGLVGGPLLFIVTALIAPAFTVSPEAPDEYLDHVADKPDLHLLSAVHAWPLRPRT
jgi:hypothetical protein